jgi:phosphoglucosamine mutase
MVSVKPHIFRAYDIRGVYGQDLDEEVAELIGLAYGTFLGNRGRVVVGRDVRIGGEVLVRGLARGLTRAGCDVLDVGMVSTPMLYFSTVYFKVDGGVQVTASHNPPEWNGFKIVKPGGATLSAGAGMEQLKDMVINRRFRECKRPGKIERADILMPYIEFMSSRFKIDARMRIAVDYSNGAAAISFPKIAERLGIEIVSINDVPDGRFPGHLPEPTEEALKDLQRLVVESGADFGAGFDGDGDRVVFVDDLGRIIPGDITLAIYVKHLDKRGKVVYDVSSSSALREIILEKGCEPVEMRVGRAFLLNAVRELNAVIGGEKSNHFYFPEIWGFDDAVYATIRMAEIVARAGKKLSKLVDEIPKYPSIPIRTFECPDELKDRVVEEIARYYREKGLKVSTIDGVKAYFDDGWILVRQSNTMPQVKMTAEARTEKRLSEIVGEAEDMIRETIRRLSRGA